MSVADEKDRPKRTIADPSGNAWHWPSSPDVKKGWCVKSDSSSHTTQPLFNANQGGDRRYRKIADLEAKYSRNPGDSKSENAATLDQCRGQTGKSPDPDQTG